ncbi:MAG: hypothetical protein V7609_1049 [Verrucomicrobiota bacterium]
MNDVIIRSVDGIIPAAASLEESDSEFVLMAPVVESGLNRHLPKLSLLVAAPREPWGDNRCQSSNARAENNAEKAGEGSK